jgi:CBS domain-containing protein
VRAGDLTLEEVRCCTSNVSVSEVLETFDDPVVLVVDGSHHDRLVGILTPADLL